MGRTFPESGKLHLTIIADPKELMVIYVEIMEGKIIGVNAMTKSIIDLSIWIEIWQMLMHYAAILRSAVYCISR